MNVSDNVEKGNTHCLTNYNSPLMVRNKVTTLMVRNINDTWVLCAGSERTEPTHDSQTKITKEIKQLK